MQLMLYYHLPRETEVQALNDPLNAKIISSQTQKSEDYQHSVIIYEDQVKLREQPELDEGNKNDMHASMEGKML